MRDLERQFDRAMYAIYEQAKEFDYYATYFKRMLDEHGGLKTARRLLKPAQPQQGLFRLWENGALEISVEATVLKDEYRSLFSEEELAEAERRLRDLGYEFGH